MAAYDLNGQDDARDKRRSAALASHRIFSFVPTFRGPLPHRRARQLRGAGECFGRRVAAIWQRTGNKAAKYGARNDGRRRADRRPEARGYAGQKPQWNRVARVCGRRTRQRGRRPPSHPPPPRTSPWRPCRTQSRACDGHERHQPAIATATTDETSDRRFRRQLADANSVEDPITHTERPRPPDQRLQARHELD